jgi:hypothetical protein
VERNTARDSGAAGVRVRDGTPGDSPVCAMHYKNLCPPSAYVT